MQGTWRLVHRERAFTLVEVLVCLGVIAIVASLLMSKVGAMRTIARQTSSSNNIRQIATAVMAYAGEYKDLPPVLYQPIEAYYPPDVQTVTVNGRTVRGQWFYTGIDYHYALTPPLPPSTLTAPGYTWLPSISTGDGPTSWRTDYNLTDTFYADPAYWNRFTQRGPSQWAAQPLTKVRFPSDKGMLRQWEVFAVPGHPGVENALVRGVISSVAWCDGSAGSVDQSTLPPGEPNFWHHSGPRYNYLSDGTTIQNTLHGVYGRDRGTRDPGPPAKAATR